MACPSSSAWLQRLGGKGQVLRLQAADDKVPQVARLGLRAPLPAASGQSRAAMTRMGTHACPPCPANGQALQPARLGFQAVGGQAEGQVAEKGGLARAGVAQEDQAAVLPAVASRARRGRVSAPLQDWSRRSRSSFPRSERGTWVLVSRST